MDQPNVIIIMSDQMKATASHLYGSKFCRTPSLECLASEGVLYKTRCDTPSIVWALSPFTLDITIPTLPWGPAKRDADARRRDPCVQAVERGGLPVWAHRLKSLF
jgi:hypothetical protein